MEQKESLSEQERGRNLTDFCYQRKLTLTHAGLALMRRTYSLQRSEEGFHMESIMAVDGEKCTSTSLLNDLMYNFLV